MSLTHFFYEPFYSLADFDKLFDEAFSARSGNGDVQRRQSRGNVSASNGGLLRPRMDLHDNKETNTVTATFELPGLKKEDVHLDVHNNTLTISGETNIDSMRDESSYTVRERRFGKFSRTLPLPEGIKHEEIKAAMDNGVLTVTFPKTTPEQAPHRITIS
ncbi:HSP20-like chaperone [Dentipellis sp. KUC8613]|nr:HSP20-like chaperone [Dentipellis sp. KUC8613]